MNAPSANKNLDSAEFGNPFIYSDAPIKRRRLSSAGTGPIKLCFSAAGRVASGRRPVGKSRGVVGLPAPQILTCGSTRHYRGKAVKGSGGGILINANRPRSRCFRPYTFFPGQIQLSRPARSRLDGGQRNRTLHLRPAAVRFCTKPAETTASSPWRRRSDALHAPPACQGHSPFCLTPSPRP